MANIEEAFVAHLISDPTIKSLIEYETGKFDIYPILVPPEKISDVEYAITYTLIAGNDDSFLDIQFPMFQFNAIGNTYAKAKELANAIKNSLIRFKGLLGNERDVKYIWKTGEVQLYDEDSEKYFMPIDLKFKYKGDSFNS